MGAMIDLPAHATVFIVGLLAVGMYVHTARFTSKTIANGPTIFTTFGIFATFFGIALGLLEFDVENIQGSVPALLDGLKTAFFASVVGVFIALSIKIRHTIWGIPRKFHSNDAHGSTLDDLVKQMYSVQQSLVGTDDATLLSQLKLARQDSNDRLDALKKSLHDFMGKMADSNSKALIQALQEVIRDFNTKINEQFGENFRHLNEAVAKILVWQENYRSQITEMIEQQRQTALNMELASSQYGDLVSKAGQFNAVSEGLRRQLEQSEVHKNQMEQMLHSLVRVVNAASNGLPQVEQKILELTRQMTDGVKENQREILSLLKDASAAMQSNLNENQKTFLEAARSVNQSLNGHVTNIMDKTKEQFQTLDAALEKELTKSLETLGRQLAALSRQFVDDYSPLTEKLRALVSVGRINQG